jgi:general secretion pathway protein G
MPTELRNSNLPKSCQSARPRRGFTLVEMLVVIVIITALAALLVPAVMISIRRAKQARIALEVANISKALERYKVEMGEYPPDFSYSALGATPTDKALRAKQLINEHLQSVFRRRGGNDLPLGSTAMPADVQLAQLNPGNALAFWLKGFTSDPQFPISGIGERTSFFDLDQGRLKNSAKMQDISQMPSPDPNSNVELGLVWGYRNGDSSPPTPYAFADGYYPSGDADKAPYIYYNAKSYTPQTNIPPGQQGSFNPIAVLPAVQWAEQNGVCPPYRSDSNLGSPQGPFAEHNKFQIISAGLDSEYGTIALGSSGNPDWTQVENYPEIPSGDAMHQGHRDNITNFTEGTINDVIKE